MVDHSRRRSQAAGSAAAEPSEALSVVVQRLRSELDGVRRAMRNRAVIEQAKGVLAARLQIGPEDAFDHLLELSQRTNTKLVEVASALVGTVTPDPAAPEATGIYTDELRQLVKGRRRRTPAKPSQPATRDAGSPRTAPDSQTEISASEREALKSQHHLLAGRCAAATSYDELLAAIVDTITVWPPVAVAMLTVTEVDGALRTVASRGLDAELHSQWRRIPPQVDVPLTAAVRDRAPLLLSEPELTEMFPIVTSVLTETKAVVCLPLLDDDRVIGALGLSWNEPMPLTGPHRNFLVALADGCARAVRAVSGDADPDPLTGAEPTLTVDHRIEYGLLPIVLEPLYDAAALLTPITDGDQIVDFKFEYANRAARRLSAAENLDLSNATLLQLFPEVGSRLLLGEYTKVLRTGVPHRLNDLHIAADDEGTRDSYTFAASATRIAGRVLVVWRIRTDADLLHVQLLQAEGIARAGSFWWNLRSGDLRWSPEMYRLFGRNPKQRAAGLEELQNYVNPDDWLGVQNAFNRLLEGRATELEFRLTGHQAGRRLRLRAEPIVKNSEVYAISGTVRDVSEERAAEARLRRAEEALASQRLRLESERHAAASLRDAVLPAAPDLATTPGLATRGLVRSPERSEKVAGDWYDVIPLPDQRTVLVVGDVAGSGLAATTAASQLRSAVRAYAVLGMSPGELLSAVNRMLCELDPDRLATLSVADFTPQERRLRWAAAGQATPIRYFGNRDAEALAGAVGVPIGAIPDTRYAEVSVSLTSGERILLYTDGLVARRTTGSADGQEVLLRAGHEVDLDDIEALVSQVNDKLGSPPHDDLCLVTARVL